MGSPHRYYDVAAIESTLSDIELKAMVDDLIARFGKQTHKASDE